jgi:hypothetical protein
MANWSTLIPVIISSILVLLSLKNLINYYVSRKTNNLIFVYIIFIIGLLVREEMYSVGVIIAITAIVDIIKFKKKFDKIFLKFSLLIIFTMLLHVFLRKFFVPDIVSFSFGDFKIGYLKYLLSTLSPGGFNVLDKSGRYLFFLTLFSYLIIAIKNYKNIFSSNSTLLIVFIIGFLLTLPSLIISRVWLFLPNLFFISVLFEALSRGIDFNFKSYLPLLIVFLLFFSSGVLRSSYFYKTFSKNSVYMIDYDLVHTRGFYGYETMPKIRRERFKSKYNHIEKKANSFRYLDLLIEKAKEDNSKLIIPLYPPLSF